MKVSSTSSTSSTSSLGNTSLKGFGGLVSGLDRDALIEQLTKSTSTKITEKKQAITKEEWKQEALQNISDKVINLEDDYLSYFSSSSVKDNTLYAANVVTAKGNSDATKYVTASGSSSMMKYLTVEGVKQLATSATLVSGTKGKTSSITSAALNENATLPNITGGSSKITFGEYTGTGDNAAFQTYSTFTFPTSYTDANGKTVTIDYTGDASKIVDQLNEYLKQNSVKVGNNGEVLHFALNDNGTLQMQAVKKDTLGNITSTDTTGSSTYSVKAGDGVLKALGVNITALNASDSDYSEKGSTLGQINAAATKTLASSLTNQDTPKIDYLKTKSLTFTYGSETHSLSISNTDQSAVTDIDTYVKALQSSADKAFGSGKVTVTANGDGTISFGTTDSTKALSVTSSDPVVRKNLGIAENASTTVNRSASIYDNRVALGFDESLTEDELNEKLADFRINGASITGITANTKIDDLLSKINATADAGVKATYLSGSNQFALIATNTGSGRTIELSDGAASTIFGIGTDGSGSSQDGKDAILQYNYGGTISQTVTSSSNTFNLEGMSVTVSGTFGYVKDSSGNMTDTIDSSMGVTFSAAADADKAAERVKKFITAFNEIATAVNDQIRTRPDRSYTVLTEDQEDDMTEKQIEEWNKKAKAGILYNDTAVREFSNSLQTVNLQMLRNGFTNEDLESIGITFSDDTTDGGQITFNEEKFKKAMESDPDKVSEIMAGGNGRKGMVETVENILTPYATRYSGKNNGSYGKLIEEGGSSKLNLTKTNNEIYKSIKQMNTELDSLKTLLKTEQDRYIDQFTNLETIINNMNAQSAYISGIGS